MHRFVHIVACLTSFNLTLKVFCVNGRVNGPETDGQNNGQNGYNMCMLENFMYTQYKFVNDNIKVQSAG